LVETMACEVSEVRWPMRRERVRWTWWRCRSATKPSPSWWEYVGSFGDDFFGDDDA
jgi:hypothetical protein